MKLVLGYIASFLFMTVVVTTVFYGLFAFIVGIVAFVSWSLPGAHIVWLTALRVCISVGMIGGLWFICSKEGQDCAKEFVNEYIH